MSVAVKRVVWEGGVGFGRMCRWEWVVLKKKADPEAPFDWPLANTSHQKMHLASIHKWKLFAQPFFSFFRHKA